MWLNELWQRCIRGTRPSHMLRRRQRRRTWMRARLFMETLEDRLSLASQMYQGLEFMTADSFRVSSDHVVTSTTPVEVGVEPPAGGDFTHLLLLQNGVQFTSTDTSGTFTTSGAVSAYEDGTTVSLLDAQAHTFTASGLLSSTGYDVLPSSDQQRRRSRRGRRRCGRHGFALQRPLGTRRARQPVAA